jgi:aerobic carbon-monoxide dehydrogenase small subunit
MDTGVDSKTRAPIATRLLGLTVNGQRREQAVAPDISLLDYLRESLGLTGAKRGCDLGECGCCAVLVDGRPMLACLLPAADLEHSAITTIEGIADGPALHPLQQAMIDEGAVQCGYCTPAMVINGVHLLATDPAPDEQAIRQCVSATTCRCTGYNRILQAYRVAAGAQATSATVIPANADAVIPALRQAQDRQARGLAGIHFDGVADLQGTDKIKMDPGVRRDDEREGPELRGEAEHRSGASADSSTPGGARK